jgi:hypothetical protein
VHQHYPLRIINGAADLNAIDIIVGWQATAHSGKKNSLLKYGLFRRGVLDGGALVGAQA